MGSNYGFFGLVIGQGLETLVVGYLSYLGLVIGSGPSWDFLQLVR